VAASGWFARQETKTNLTQIYFSPPLVVLLVGSQNLSFSHRVVFVDLVRLKRKQKTNINIQATLRRIFPLMSDPVTRMAAAGFGGTATTNPSYFLSSLLSFATGVVVSWWYLRSQHGSASAARRGVQSVKSTSEIVAKRAAVVLRQDEETQLALVVRKDLKMGTGKIAAQCAHAAVAVVEDIQSNHAGGSSRASSTSSGADEGDGGHAQWLSVWLKTGSPKVALQVDSEAALVNLAKEAKALSLPFYVIRDAGRTQIAAGSKTVVAIGPAPKSRVQAITGKLKLL
jgi:peptidyl-tRNA hydrolase, PTH2 family